MIRDVKPQDATAITKIYNEYITNSIISFETEPLTEEDMLSRIVQISSKYPYLVYETDGIVVGYCYAHTWKERAAYRYTAETTVYLSPAYTGRGIGTLLMQKLIEECRNKNYRALIACITDDNIASISGRPGVCAGWTGAHFKKVGLKFDRWLDVVDYELLLTP